jgi:hypothetical protein
MDHSGPVYWDPSDRDIARCGWESLPVTVS